jgi:Xaa-Pro aminopeptidase
VAAKTRTEVSGRSRVDRLRLSFSTLGVDAFLVTHLPNVRYLCGFSGSAGVLLVETTRSTLFTDARYTLQAREEMSDSRVEIAGQSLLKASGEALRSRRKRMRVAFSPSQVTVVQRDALQIAGGGRVRWVDGGNAVEKLRAIKDSEELVDMRAAAVLISDVFSKIIRMVKPGIAELQLAAEIEYSMKQKGAMGASFETIVASGLRSAWPHARATSKLLSKNELVVLDQGAILRGYCSDMTRTVFLGRSPTKLRRLYGAVLEAQEAAKAAIRPGVAAGDVDAAARRVLQRRGLGRYFTHSTGHGLGIEVHEMPRLGRNDNTKLEEGMVVTVEPGVYLEGTGGIRIEDDVLVTATGCVDLTNATREFLEL